MGTVNTVNTANPGEYVYVVYWKHLDFDKPRKSIMEILGVYTEEKEALRVEKSHNRRRRSRDDESDWLCYASIEKIELNKINL